MKIKEGGWKVNIDFWKGIGVAVILIGSVVGVIVWMWILQFASAR